MNAQAESTRPISALALRERLSQLRRERGAVVARPADHSALADLPAGIAGVLSPSLSERLGRMRPWVGKERSCLVNTADVARHLGGELSDPGVVCVEQRYPLPLRHGCAALNAAFNVPSRLFSKEGGAPIPTYDAVFLDTETTGLSAGTGTVAFMIGVARFAEHSLHLTQWIITGFAGERPMLAALKATLANVRLIVTYNGAAFDLPLLRTRFRMHQLADSMTSCAHADLLPWARRNRRKEWPDARLQTLERHGLGVERIDDLPGAEVPKAWSHWLSAGDAGPLRRAVEHNRLDLITVAVLLERASRHAHGVPRQCDPRQAWLFEQPSPWTASTPTVTARSVPFIRDPWRQHGPKAVQTVI